MTTRAARVATGVATGFAAAVPQPVSSHRRLPQGGPSELGTAASTRSPRHSSASAAINIATIVVGADRQLMTKPGYSGPRLISNRRSRASAGTWR